MTKLRNDESYLSSIPFLTLVPLQATVFYLDPVNGDMLNDGSFNAPWSTLQEVFDQNLIETRSYSPLPYSNSSTLQPKNIGAPVKAGDTLMLRNGYHGTVFYRGIYNLDYITIMNEAGHQPAVGNIKISAGSKIIFDGLLISPESAPVFFTAQLFHLESHSWHGPSRDIIIKNCELRGTNDASSWGLTEWNEVGSCIKISGNKTRVENCTCLNIDEGIAISADSCEVKNNAVINFAGDGMRGQGSHLLFEYNLVKNCYDIDGNHDDGFQSFTNTAKPFVGNILRGNTIINYENINQPFRGTLQGIGCFDGPYVDWTIENNLVVVNHYHGISLYGAENCKVINNTVVDIDSVNSPNGTWIKITDHKNGTPSVNCVIQNNISFGFSYGQETTFLSNLLISDYQNFTSNATSDFTLRPGSSAIDAGENSGAPMLDLHGTPRPQNSLVDIGAYECIPPMACTRDTWNITQDLTQSNIEMVKQWMQTNGNVKIWTGTSLLITIGTFAEFNAGFEIETHAVLDISIGICQDP